MAQTGISRHRRQARELQALWRSLCSVNTPTRRPSTYLSDTHTTGSLKAVRVVKHTADMSFEHAPVTKALMLGIAVSSIAIGIFDLKHYMHLQIVPHISKYHQYWRLFTHHLICANSSDLLLAELLLYNVAVRMRERSAVSNLR
ncbi:uncharacterized protein B0H18DRAFT_3271 [Fomitopsis serialis]|uniref:uncharacterized protein n=1 Tax=Fomitopsis serialis TaxID=139415 RepID=UPI002007B665|nr:uncharacterized protein B0H18DRAFT_3271 [Neoantrodia serialis]KAH9938104.1 hypothetical protein B0H18DRAFT_3271 [Neoantrodia serialis]